MESVICQAVRKRREEETSRLGVKDMWAEEQYDHGMILEDPPAGGQLQVGFDLSVPMCTC
jgi:hypothetical protein